MGLQGMEAFQTVANQGIEGVQRQSEELKSLLMKVKEESQKVGLASGPITSWQIDGEKVEAVADF